MHRLGERKLGLVAGASRDAGAGVKTKERASARRERWLQGWLRVATIFVPSNNPWHSVRDCCKECRAERESVLDDIGKERTVGGGY